MLNDGTGLFLLGDDTDIPCKFNMVGFGQVQNTLAILQSERDGGDASTRKIRIFAIPSGCETGDYGFNIQECDFTVFPRALAYTLAMFHKNNEDFCWTLDDEAAVLYKQYNKEKRQRERDHLEQRIECCLGNQAEHIFKNNAEDYYRDEVPICQLSVAIQILRTFCDISMESGSFHNSDAKFSQKITRENLQSAILLQYCFNRQREILHLTIDAYEGYSMNLIEGEQADKIILCRGKDISVETTVLLTKCWFVPVDHLLRKTNRLAMKRVEIIACLMKMSQKSDSFRFCGKYIAEREVFIKVPGQLLNPYFLEEKDITMCVMKILSCQIQMFHCAMSINHGKYVAQVARMYPDFGLNIDWFINFCNQLRQLHGHNITRIRHILPPLHQPEPTEHKNLLTTERVRGLEQPSEIVRRQRMRNRLVIYSLLRESTLTDAYMCERARNRKNTHLRQENGNDDSILQQINFDFVQSKKRQDTKSATSLRRLNEVIREQQIEIREADQIALHLQPQQYPNDSDMFLASMNQSRMDIDRPVNGGFVPDLEVMRNGSNSSISMSLSTTGNEVPSMDTIPANVQWFPIIETPNNSNTRTFDQYRNATNPIVNNNTTINTDYLQFSQSLIGQQIGNRSFSQNESINNYSATSNDLLQLSMMNNTLASFCNSRIIYKNSIVPDARGAYVCHECQKQYSYKRSFRRHVQIAHSDEKDRKIYSCLDCYYATPYSSNLKKHQKIHLRAQKENSEFSNKSKEESEPPEKKKRKQTDLPEVQDLPEPENVFNLSKQTLLDEGYADEAVECLLNSIEFVRTKYTGGGKVKRQYNIRFKNEDIDVEYLKDLLMKIHALQSSAYRLNMSFGCLLQHNETGEWRYFYPTQDPTLRYWPEPFTVRSREDLLRVLEQSMDYQDIHDYLTIRRPATPWVIKRLVCFNAVLYLLPEQTLLGANVVTLPKYITNHRYIKTLLPYKQSYCFFRCLSYHLNGRNVQKIQHRAKQLATQFAQYLGIQKFSGHIKLHQLLQAELCFGLKITVYTLVPKTKDNEREQNTQIFVPDNHEAQLIRSSPRNRSEAKNGELNLDMSNGHLSVITSIDHYANSFLCNNCGKFFTNGRRLNQHIKTCLKRSVKQRAIHKAGSYKIKKTVFDKLQSEGFQLNPDDRFSEYYSSFDFETLNIQLDNSNTDKNLQFTGVLELCSCSINSSVPGFCKPYFIRRYTTEAEFMHRVITYLSEIAQAAEKLQRLKLEHVFEQVSSRLEEIKLKIAESSFDEDLKQYHEQQWQNIENLRQDLEKYVLKHVVYAFNGSRFDLKVSREYLLRELFSNNMQLEFVIKKHGAYVLLATNTLVFKDMASLLAPGTSLDKFLSAYKLPFSKWSFPYSYMTSLSKLDETELPPYEEFYSTLKDKYLVTIEEYGEIRDWFSANATCLWDYLKEYNNRDVEGMIPGLEILRQFWKGYDICMIDDGISLSSLSAMLMHKSVPKDKPFIWLPGKQSSYVHELASKSIVGGPAIVWKRYSETNKTYIRNGQNICKSILGLDANALYLWCLSKQMPTSYAVEWKLRSDTGKFHRKPLIPWWSSVGEIEYCFWIQHVNDDPNLLHTYNYGQKFFCTKQDAGSEDKYKTKYVNKYRPDAYSRKYNTVSHYFGCWWHFCGDCVVGQKRIAADPEKAKIVKQRDEEMINNFSKLGFKQEIMRECEWKLKKETEHELKEFLDKKLNMPLSKCFSLTKEQILEKIATEQLFGLAKVSLHVPDDKYDKFKEFCPIFINREVTRDDLSPFALAIAQEQGELKTGRRSLISVMKAEDIVLITPLIKWYMDHGLIIDDISDVVQFKSESIYNKFAEGVTHHRKEADYDPTKAQIGLLHKTTGNAAYGKTLENRSNFTTTIFTDEQTASKLVNKKNFIDLESISSELYEVTLTKTKFIDNVPRIVGAFVLGYAKLRLLEAYHDFLDRFFDRSTWELICADTDSLYLALSEESLENFEKLVIPEKLVDYKKVRDTFLTTNTETQRNPGLFKVEYQGTGIIALAPKVYYAWNDETNNTKKSCKGINQRQALEKEKYLSVLETQKTVVLENRGFRYQGGKMYEYRQKKRGLLYLYVKRRLNPDGITTEPIIQ